VCLCLCVSQSVRAVLFSFAGDCVIHGTVQAARIAHGSYFNRYVLNIIIIDYLAYELCEKTNSSVHGNTNRSRLPRVRRALSVFSSAAERENRPVVEWFLPLPPCLTATFHHMTLRARDTIHVGGTRSCAMYMYVYNTPSVDRGASGEGFSHSTGKNGRPGARDPGKRL